MVSHAQAREWAIAGTTAALGREPTYNEVLFVQAVALAESTYGQGWVGPGVRSNNMGAVQAKPLNPPCMPGKQIECDPATSFVNGDSRPNSDGTSTGYECCYRKYPTPIDGMQDVARIMYVRMKIDPTSIEAVSTQMYDAHYYEGRGATREDRIAWHVKALTRHLKTLTTALDEPMPPLTDNDVSDDSGPSGGILLGFGIGAALVAWGIVAVRR